MEKSMDFSEGISLIKEAHSDSIAILEKWRELIEKPGEVTLSIKYGDGAAREITIPTIREAINRYLGGVFEQITLTDGTNTVTVRLNESGNVELVQANGSPSGISVKNLTVSSIRGTDTVLPIYGNVSFRSGTISNGTVERLEADGGVIYNGTFKGETHIEGATTITGTATIRNANVTSLSTGRMVYRKQVIQWAKEGIIDAQILSPGSTDTWTGSEAALQRAGIYETPTWCDCMYVPGPIGESNSYVKIYWGNTGSIPITYGGSTSIPTPYMALWPYKRYEKVGSAYRIRWLPLNTMDGRISCIRTGTVSYPVNSFPASVQETRSNGTITVTINDTQRLVSYRCRRIIAKYFTDSGNIINRLYPM